MNIPNKIGPFVRYTKKPTAMQYGYYYCAEMILPFAKESKRMVRVWLPEDYDFSNPEKRFPIIYMSDGQNLVDRYLSAFGEWELDKTVHKLLKEKVPSIIAVGIDCPKDPAERGRELSPPHLPKNKFYQRVVSNQITYVDKYIDYIVDAIKPLVDELFFTSKEKKDTAVGGSSMGGLMSYYAYIYKPDVFGFSLSFSPAFFFYGKNEWNQVMDLYSPNPEKNGKLYLYSGGKDFEKKFLKPTINTYEYLVNKGFKNEQVTMLIDTKEIHHEAAWAKYLPDALRYWLKKK